MGEHYWTTLLSVPKVSQKLILSTKPFEIYGPTIPPENRGRDPSRLGNGNIVNRFSIVRVNTYSSFTKI